VKKTCDNQFKSATSYSHFQPFIVSSFCRLIVPSFVLSSASSFVQCKTQNIISSYHAVATLVFFSPGQTIATCQRNIVGRNMLCAFGHRVWTWHDMLGVVGSNLKMIKFEPTTSNMSQQGGQTHTTCCAQQCCDMLRWHVAIVWLRLYVAWSNTFKKWLRPDISSYFRHPHR